MRLAIFDFDGTLFRGDTLPALGREWIRQKRSRASFITTYLSILPGLALYKLDMLPSQQFRSRAVAKFNRLFRNMSEDDIKTFFTAAYKGLADLFNKQVLDELKELQRRGYYCILLSGAYHTLLQIVAENLGIDKVAGTELKYKANGIFDHHSPLEVIGGIRKVEVLKTAIPQNAIDWQGSCSFGDSYSDRFIMEMVGDPVAVNPDPELLDYARLRGWRIIGG